MTPDDHRREAAQLEDEAARLEALAKGLREDAAKLRLRADLDEQTPPSRRERIDRLLERF